jgi:protocatechuate 3,4-dioxygenase beta subunit
VTVPPNATANFTARASETGNRLTGVVVTTDGSGPSGVTISIGGQTAVTDASGRYTITGLAPGTYPISASKPGYVVFGPSEKTIVTGANTANFTARPN